MQKAPNIKYPGNPRHNENTKLKDNRRKTPIQGGKLHPEKSKIVTFHQTQKKLTNQI